MARIDPVTARQGGLQVWLAYFFTGRILAKLAGREPAETVTAVGMYAHFPGLPSAYGKLEQATGRLQLVDRRTQYLAELKAATSSRFNRALDIGAAGYSDGMVCVVAGRPGAGSGERA